MEKYYHLTHVKSSNNFLDYRLIVNKTKRNTMEKNIPEERKKRFSRIWSTSRSDAGKSREFMANGLGVSVKTIQNWENGNTFPDLFLGSEWFRVLGLNPLPYYLAYIFPDFFDGIAPEDEDHEIEDALMMYIQNLTTAEKRQLLYLIAGHHGSPWYSLLQMFTAHCHTSMKSRVNVARTILDNYEMEEMTGDLVCTDNVAPNLNILRNAIEEGKRAVINNTKGYTNVIPERQTNGENS